MKVQIYSNILHELKRVHHEGYSGLCILGLLITDTEWLKLHWISATKSAFVVPASKRQVPRLRDVFSQ